MKGTGKGNKARRDSEDCLLTKTIPKVHWIPAFAAHGDSGCTLNMPDIVKFAGIQQQGIPTKVIA